MMQLLMLLMGLFFLQDPLPYKPNEQFEVKLDYTLKQRAANDTKINLEYENTTSVGPLPFLGIKLTVLKLGPDEARIRIMTNHGNTVVNKKAQEKSLIEFDMGFTADLKDRIAPHEYTVYFLSADKKEKSKIVITVDQDGTFLINNEKRGRL